MNLITKKKIGKTNSTKNLNKDRNDCQCHLLTNEESMFLTTHKEG